MFILHLSTINFIHFTFSFKTFSIKLDENFFDNDQFYEDKIIILKQKNKFSFKLIKYFNESCKIYFVDVQRPDKSGSQLECCLYFRNNYLSHFVLHKKRGRPMLMQSPSFVDPSPSGDMNRLSKFKTDLKNEVGPNNSSIISAKRKLWWNNYRSRRGFFASAQAVLFPRSMIER